MLLDVERKIHSRHRRHRVVRQAFRGKRCEPGFRYNSGTNTQWLSVEELRRLIKEHVDPSFEV